MNNLSTKNKIKSRKNLYESVSTRALNKKKNHNHSHPKSNYHFKSDFISNLNKSLLKNKLNLSYKSFLDFPSSKSLKNYYIQNVFSSNKKKLQKASKYKGNNINIKVQNNNKIKKISPSNMIKKKGIPKIRKKNCQSLNKKKSYRQFIQRNFQPRYKSNKYSTIGINVTSSENITNKDNSSFSKKKNNSEYLNEKKVNVLYSSMPKTLNNESKYNNKRLKYLNFLSPSYGSLLHLIPKIKSPLNFGIHDGKISYSFSRRNNSKNMNLTNIKDNKNKINNNFDIKKILLSKIENEKLKNLNLIYKRRKKNISDSKSNNKYSAKKITKISNPNSKGKSNNINTINNTINNQLNKIKKKIIKPKS